MSFSLVSFEGHNLLASQRNRIKSTQLSLAFQLLPSPLNLGGAALESGKWQRNYSPMAFWPVPVPALYIYLLQPSRGVGVVHARKALHGPFGLPHPGAAATWYGTSPRGIWYCCTAGEYEESRGSPTGCWHARGGCGVPVGVPPHPSLLLAVFHSFLPLLAPLPLCWRGGEWVGVVESGWNGCGVVGVLWVVCECLGGGVGVVGVRRVVWMRSPRGCWPTWPRNWVLRKPW